MGEIQKEAVGSADVRLGDCLELLQTIPAPVQLVYLDPPFFTGETFRMKDGRVAFEDRWPSLLAYVQHVTVRALRAWHRLQPGCSMVVHVDPVTSHHVKVALDGLVRRENFANEIIWRYRRWPVPSRNFQRMHDVLLRYVKPGAPARFNQLYEPRAESTIRSFGKDRIQRARFVTDPDGKKRRHRSYATVQDEPSKGARLSDVWDLGIIAPMSHERTGYPTQKPEKLLCRVIEALTNPGDMVVDLMCGSGTTLVAAVKLGRDAVGIDSSEVAVMTARARLDRVMAAAGVECR